MKENVFLSAARCRRLTESGWVEEPVSLVTECRLSLCIDGILQPDVICSPTEPEELIVGRLIADGRIHRAEEIRSLQLHTGQLPERMSAEVRLAAEPYAPSAQEPVRWDAAMLQKLSDYVVGDALQNRSSHSTHSCTLMQDGEILCCREDISRHNAIDRAIGWAALHNAKLPRCIAFFSGRISSDAIEKAAHAGISVLCAKALPSAQAAKLAAEKSITLLHCSKSRGILQF